MLQEPLQADSSVRLENILSVFSLQLTLVLILIGGNSMHQAKKKRKKGKQRGGE